MRIPQKYKSLLCYIVITFVMQNIYIWGSSLDRLCSFSIVDDSFYYLKIARNFMMGHGVSFDGINKTNGFQPLWEILQLPLGLIQSKSVCLRLLCSMCALVFNLGIIFIYLYIRGLYNGRVAILTILLWISNTRIVFTYALSGMEFSLFILSTTALLYFYNKHARLQKPTTIIFFVIGILSGICALSRIDGILIGLILAIASFTPAIKDGKYASACRGLCFIGLGFSIVTAPYFIWNYSNFSHLLPVSGTIKLDYTRKYYASLGIDGFGIQRPAASLKTGGIMLLKYIARFISGYYYYFLRLFDVSQTANALLGLSILGASVSYCMLKFKKQFISDLKKSTPQICFIALHFLTLALLLDSLLDYGNWYFGPLYLFICSILAVAVDLFYSGLPAGFKAALTGLVAINIFSFLLLHDEPKINVLGAKDCLNYLERKMEREMVGSWNAGYLGYFSEKNTITNLDGLVGDYTLAEYHLGHLSILEYLKQNKIRYLCDYLPTPEDIQTGFYGLKPTDYEVLYASPFYLPPFIDSRIYYVLKLTY